MATRSLLLLAFVCVVYFASNVKCNIIVVEFESDNPSPQSQLPQEVKRQAIQIVQHCECRTNDENQITFTWKHIADGKYLLTPDNGPLKCDQTTSGICSAIPVHVESCTFIPVRAGDNYTSTCKRANDPKNLNDKYGKSIG